MSATEILRRRSVRMVAIAATALVALAGCTTGQSSASSYDEARDNFLEGCVDRAEADNALIEEGGEGTGEAVAIADPEAYCECAFTALEDDVPFDVYREANERLTEEGGALPDEILEAYASCAPGAG